MVCVKVHHTMSLLLWLEQLGLLNMHAVAFLFRKSCRSLE